MKKLEIYIVEGIHSRELSPREYEAVEYYGNDIVEAFPIEGPTGQRYVPTSAS